MLTPLAFLLFAAAFVSITLLSVSSPSGFVSRDLLGKKHHRWFDNVVSAGRARARVDDFLRRRRRLRPPPAAANARARRRAPRRASARKTGQRPPHARAAQRRAQWRARRAVSLRGSSGVRRLLALISRPLRPQSHSVCYKIFSIELHSRRRSVEELLVLDLTRLRGR